jgi:hypothetical protein
MHSTTCPQCGVVINYRGSSVGTVTRCRNCSHKFQLHYPLLPLLGGLLGFLLACGCLMWVVTRTPQSATGGDTARATAPRR